MKKILSIILVTIMLFGVVTVTFADEQDDIKVMVNGDVVEFDQQPIIISDRVLVPMRAIFEALGANVIYEKTEIYGTRIFAITDESIVLINGFDDRFGIYYWNRHEDGEKAFGYDSSVDLYESYMKSSGYDPLPFKYANLDGIDIMIIGGRTLVPIRAISDCLGAKSVEWEGQTKTVKVNKDISTPWKTEEEIKQMDSFFDNFSFDDCFEWMSKEGWEWNYDTSYVRYMDRNDRKIGVEWGYDFYGAYVKMPIRKLENKKIWSVVTFYYDGTIHVAPWSQGY